MSSPFVITALLLVTSLLWYGCWRVTRRPSRERAVPVERLAGVSHEIRTPLNGILGLSQLLLQMKPTPEQREYLEMIRSSGAALLTVLNDILDYSRIHGGRVRLESAPFHVRRWVRQCVKTLAPQAHTKGLELAYWVEPEVPGVVEADAVRLQQVLVNLIVNAIKYTDEGEVVVDVGASETKGDLTLLRFSVRDTGIGIPRSRHRSIFEAFTQANEAPASQHSGLGLGLAISSEIAEHMGGAIRVESEPGAGSAFHVEIPVRNISDLDEEERCTVSLEGVRALVVDDSEVQRDLLGRQLRLWGVDVTTAGHAEAAIAALSSPNGFSFALVDSRMPGVDTYALAGEIQRARIPAVLMTLAHEHLGPETLRAKGFVGQLSKPVAPSQLLRAIAIMRRGEATRRAENDASPTGDHLPLRGLRVLVAEDDSVNRMLVVRALENNGAAVVAVTNGADALRSSDEGFDVAVLDVEMPQRDGLSVACEIRRRERESGRHSTLIAITAHARREDRERCMAAGMDAFLCKPFEEIQLVSVVEQAWNRDWGREVFHHDAALKRANGDRTLLSELVDVFLADFPRHLGTLAMEVEARRFSKIHRLSHRLKGALLTLAAERAANEALELETSARAEDGEQCRAVLGRLRNELHRLEAELLAQFGARPASKRSVLIR